jgi:predicted metal-dependent phosphoesterase TrpH
MELDLHVHTKYSFDSRMEPAAILRVARRRGLDGLAITDHDTIEGAQEAARLAPADFLVIVGEEISTRGGDIIGLFLKEHVAGPDPEQVIDRIHAQGGVALLPHPFSKTLGIDERAARKLDACEGFNHRYSATADPSEAVPFARAYDLTMVGSSDAHRYREIGCGRTRVEASGAEEVRRALLDGRATFSARRPGPAARAGWALVDALGILVDPIPERLFYRHDEDRP